MATSKLARLAFWPLAAVLVAGALFLPYAGQRPDRPGRAATPLDSWDMAQLVAHLNGKGLGLRAVSTLNGGSTDPKAFLTTTDKGWEELTLLFRDPSRIDQWRGTLLCERGPAVDWADLARQGGDCCQEFGPFLLFGDRELLGRVRAALSEFTPPGDWPAG
jgi:hypothetical protein